MSSGFEWDDKNFKKALRAYCDLKKNVDPKKELRRRAKNVGMRLIAIYKGKGVKLQDITQKAKSLGNRLRVRPKIKAKAKLMKWSHRCMLQAETNARRSAKGFTATGWFPAVEKLGGNPKRVIRPGGGPRRGSLVEKMGTFEKSETLINKQPGAAHTAGKVNTDMQAALDKETADMVAYIARKQNEAARKNGL